MVMFGVIWLKRIWTSLQRLPFLQPKVVKMSCGMIVSYIEIKIIEIMILIVTAFSVNIIWCNIQIKYSYFALKTT